MLDKFLLTLSWNFQVNQWKGFEREICKKNVRNFGVVKFIEIIKHK